MSKSLGPFTFDVYMSHFCCGLFEVGDFHQKDTKVTWYRGTIYKTWEEVFKNFEKNLMERLTEDMEYPLDEGGKLLQCTLNGPQKEANPELVEYLLQSGWIEGTTWKNCSHGNNVTQYSRFITHEELQAFAPDDEDEDDEY